MSSINPNNIDGTYPIAGQDNDSQGFRDNFTNIKNNFTFAKTELEDLQSKVILKSALSGTTLDNNLNNAQLKGAQIVRQTETRSDLGSLSGTVTVDWSEGHFQTLATGGSVTLAFDGWPTSGFWTSLKLQVDVTNVAHTLTLPSEVSQNLSSVQGASGQVITFPSTGYYIFEFSTYDGGTTVWIRDLLRNYDVATASSSFTTITVSTLANVTATTAASSTTTGALKVAGGAGVAGNLHVGGSLHTSGTIVASSSEDLANTAAVSLLTATSYFTTAAAETATLAAGTEGQIKTLAMKGDSGDMVITVTNPAWSANSTATLTFGDIGDACVLQYISSKWFILSNNGVTVGA